MAGWQARALRTPGYCKNSSPIRSCAGGRRNRPAAKSSERNSWHRCCRKGAAQDPPEDLLATASLFTAMSVGGARRWIQGAVDEVIVGGGGALNRTLMADLAAVFEPAPVKRLDDLGWESKGFEAIAFAVLAYQTVRGECGNVPSVTGAVHPVILGKLIPGRWNSGRR